MQLNFVQLRNEISRFNLNRKPNINKKGITDFADGNAFLFGAFMRGNKPPVLPGEREKAGQQKKRRAKSKPKNIDIEETSVYNEM